LYCNVQYSSHVFAFVLSFIYTGQISICEDSVQAVLPAANLLQLPDVKEACSDFLKSQLHTSNCLGIKQFADLHGCIDLLAAADDYIRQNFVDVVESEEFVSLTAEQVSYFR